MRVGEKNDFKKKGRDKSDEVVEQVFMNSGLQLFVEKYHVTVG